MDFPYNVVSPFTPTIFTFIPRERYLDQKHNLDMTSFNFHFPRRVKGGESDTYLTKRVGSREEA